MQGHQLSCWEILDSKSTLYVFLSKLQLIWIDNKFVIRLHNLQFPNLILDGVHLIKACWDPAHKYDKL